MFRLRCAANNITEHRLLRVTYLTVSTLVETAPLSEDVQWLERLDLSSSSTEIAIALLINSLPQEASLENAHIM